MGEELSVTEFSNIQKGENGSQTVSDTRMGCLSFNVQSCLLNSWGYVLGKFTEKTVRLGRYTYLIKLMSEVNKAQCSNSALHI